MDSTALGTEKARKIIFISDAYKKFYYDKLKKPGIRMHVTRYFVIVLKSAMIQESM